MLPRTQAPLTNPIIVSATATLLAVAYTAMGIVPHSLARVYIGVATGISISCWAIADFRGTAMASIYDWGFFYGMAWPVLLPWYVKRRYGKRGWALIALFTALLISPILGSAITEAFRSTHERRNERLTPVNAEE